MNRPNRIEIVHDGSLDLIALNNTLNELRFGIVTLQSTLERVEEQTVKTNGRVSSLEKWRWTIEKAGAFSAGVRAGSAAVIGAIVTAATVIGGLIVKVVVG